MIPVVVGSSPIGHPISAQACAAAILQQTTARIEANARGALSADDPEFLHQLRVGMRRLRAALRAFRELLARKKRRQISQALRKLSPVLGAARDWDVLLARTAVEPRKRLRARAARRDALHAIRSRKFARLVERAKALEVQETDEPLTEFAARGLQRAHRKLMKQARGVDWSDASARHAVRIRVKRLRYTVEFFAGAFAGSAPYVAALKELQTVLGELNDLAVARRLVGLEADETLLLNRLSAAWRRFCARREFWRAGE